MLKSMVFLDHNNFAIAVKQLYYNEPQPRLNYKRLFSGISNYIGNIELIKTYMFDNEPDNFLMQDENIQKHFNWIKNLNSYRYLEVILGRLIARPTNIDIPMKIDDKTTYYKIEKGTDVNLTSELLTKAHYNAFDVAIVMSADTDYISVYKYLRNMGKIII